MYQPTEWRQEIHAFIRFCAMANLNTYLFSGLKINCGSAPVNPHDDPGRTQSSDLAL